MQQAQVLICDDNMDILETMSIALLQDHAVEVIPMESGKEVITYLMSDSPTPDQLIIDLLLPDMDGDDVTKLLRKKRKYKDLPIILMSGIIYDVEHRARVVQADLALRKPFTVKELREKVASLLQKKKAFLSWRGVR